jgi:HPt (histidine-containing phosphotransfer) domain-containing protein
MHILFNLLLAEFMYNQTSTRVFAMNLHTLLPGKDKFIATRMNDYIPKRVVREDVTKSFGDDCTNYLMHEEDEQTQLVPAENIVDLSFLKDLSGENDEFAKEMIHLFISETTFQMDALESAYKNSDYNELNRTVHKMLSSFSSMGINENGILRMLHDNMEVLLANNLLRKKMDELREIFSLSLIVLNKELLS